MEYDCFITFKPFLLRLIVVWLENSQCVHEGKFNYLWDGAGHVRKMLFACPGKKFDYDLKHV